MKTAATIVFSLIFVNSAYALDLTHNDCGHKEVHAVRSLTCKNDPCRVPIGGKVILEVDFTPTVNAKKVNIAVFATVFGFEVSLPLDDTDACGNGRLSCPIKAGEKQTLRYDLKVKDSYYPVAGDVGFRLSGENDDGTEATLACASISAELYEAITEEEKAELKKHQEL